MKDNFTININKELILRIKEYLKYAKIDSTLKTDHWAKRTSNNLDSIKINNESITIFKNDTGLSDEYEALFDKNYVKKINAKKLIKNKIINNLKIKCRDNYDPIYYYKKNLPPTPFITLDNVHAEFGKKHQDFTIYKAAFFLNEIMNSINSYDFNKKNIIEIGPGTGNLIRLIKSKYTKTNFCIVDIKSSIIFSILNLLYRFQNSTFILPNELSNIDKTLIFKKNFEFVFLNNDQLNYLPNKFFNFGINTMSFQEMHYKQIKDYFNLLRKILVLDNFFYCVNAVEKPMIVNNVNQSIRFHEYPWSAKDTDISFKLSTVEEIRTTKPFFSKLTKLHIND
tara:strand:+ start:56 stop:1069 length:1014 start_codon:yes stop_codon:yes gene_type:complete